MNGRITIWIFVSAVMIIPIGFYFAVNWYENKYQSLPVYYGDVASNVPFTLKNQNGRKISNEDLQGNIVVADFFFTHCPSICPKMTQNLRLVEAAVDNDEKVLITSFSIDPERDSVGKLAAYASRFGIGERWHLLTGDKKVIYQLARKRFFVDATDGDGGPDDFIHSDKFVLLDQSGHIRGYYKGTDEAEVKKLIGDIEKLRN